MRTSNITTAADFDAALREQREARIQRLRRLNGWNLWANGLLIAAIALQVIIFLRERSAPALIQGAVLIGFLCLVLWTTKRRKAKAAVQLEEDLHGNS